MLTFGRNSDTISLRYFTRRIHRLGMKMKNTKHHIDKNLIAFIAFPAIIGVLSGVFIFAFKRASSYLMHVSADIYGFVRENSAYLPLLLLGAAALGLVSALILKYAKECRGGGIPTAIASIRGLIPLQWVQGVFALFFSSLITYLVGVPLGNEGPSVQMGAAIGKGSSELLGNKKRAYERYLMTSGACSGFAIATGAPLSGIVFAMEELHRKSSVSLIIVAVVSILTGTVTENLLSLWLNVNTSFLDLQISNRLPVSSLWAALVIGVACGLLACCFIYLYKKIGSFSQKALKGVPFTAKIVIIFVTVAILGFFVDGFTGSGHSLIEEIIHDHAVWYIVFACLILRGVVMVAANNEGVSGGLFVPTLAIGAMVAYLLSKSFVALGLIGEEYFAILIIIGMSSFLSASMRTPITATIFCVEALCGFDNIIPIIVGTITAYLVAELSGECSFTDTVIEARAKSVHKDRVPAIVDAHVTVKAGSFAQGKELRELLLPPTLTVLSVDSTNSDAPRHAGTLHEGDVLHIHYQTYRAKDTMEILSHIFGEQENDERTKIHFGSEHHIVPLE